MALRRVGAASAALALAGALAGTPASAQALPQPGAESCGGCHSTHGGAGAPMPSLHGLKAADITAAMLDYRSDRRQPTIMNRIAKGFSEDEIKAISNWLERQP
ncbi:MAG: cytochrome C [Beijerinckiaceae bacterium]|nr:cytochrome C [Beijerinckiaceae bacterium]